MEVPLKEHKKSFLISLAVAVLFISLLKFPADDGLRHIGLAFTEIESWGQVYPYSVFETLKDYDPWFGYDFALKKVAALCRLFPASRLLAELVLTKFLSCVFVLCFLYLILARSDILRQIKDGYTFILAYAVLLGLLLPSLARMLQIRPFAFGSLYIIYTVGQRGVARGFLSSALLSFLYPYLAWLYTIPACLAHYARGDRRFSLGTALFTVLFLCLQPHAFWAFQTALFESGAVRSALDARIGEFAPFYRHIYFYLLYLVVFMALYPSFSSQSRRLNYQNLLAIFYLVPSLVYIRYFVDIVLPLLFVSFGKEILAVSADSFRRVIGGWAAVLGLSDAEGTAGEGAEASGVSLKPILVVLYAIVICLAVLVNYKQLHLIRDYRSTLSHIPAESLVITDFNMQYKILYVRPDLRLIPSSEIGFPAEEIKQEYIGFINEGNVCSLARKTDAQFFIDSRAFYISPDDSRCLRLIKSGNSCKIWRIVNPPN